MGGFFGVASKKDCVLELFYGVDYHSHLGTRRGGMAAYGKAILESDVFLITSRSRFLYSRITEVLRSLRLERSIMKKNF